MIILYEENEKKFETLGIGVLKDAISAKVSEKLNDSFELEISYPVKGKLFNELKIDRIICCKTNPYDSFQPFRIYSITKPLNGQVTVSANHISYDMNGIPVTAIDGNNLSDVINKIQNGWDEEVPKGDEIETVHKKCVLLDNEFKFNTDIFSAKSFKTTAPYNLRAILMGGDESLIGVYKDNEGQFAELKFDKFNVSILKRRGMDRGARVVYGHNMTDLNHEIMSENLYNGIFPYYHSEKSSNETTVSDEFKQVYIVGTKPFASDWLSYTEGGEAFIPVSESPIQIATEGEYKEKIYAWNESSQKYEEKIYNEQVNLIQGVFNPTWIVIDWTKFPTVTCRANKVGYYKKMSDTDWGDKKGVGDTIFSESLISGGIMQNIIICFSEVLPSDYNASNEEVSEIIDVVLDEPIIKIETPDTRNMLHDRILNVDLSSEFEETPTQDQLRNKAEEYIKKNKIGIIKHNTTVSFIDLASTTDAEKYQNFDHIELGDTVSVEYKDLGVDVKLRVISTVYDVLIDNYESVELGEKEDTMSSQSIQTGDSISSLSNDAGYTDVSTVNKLIAQTVTAEFIEAVNARISKAAIKQLEAERINVSGIIEASQFSLDTIVAKLLTAENAEIKKTLKAGEIEVAGDVNIKKGEISIESEDGKTSFKVDRNGNATANSISITGGNLDIGDGNFEVDNDGHMYAKEANIEGTITAETGKIASFYIVKDLLTTDEDIDPDNPVYKTRSIYIGKDYIMAGKSIRMNSDGTLEAGPDFNGTVTRNKKNAPTVNFKLDPDGRMTASGVKIKTGEIGYNDKGFTIDENSLGFGSIGQTNSVFLCSGSSWSGSVANSGNMDGWAIVVGNSFGVNVGPDGKGKMYCNNGKIGPLDVDSEKLIYTTDNDETWFYIDPSVEYDDTNPFKPKVSIYGRSLTCDKLLFSPCIYLENPGQPREHNEWAHWLLIDKETGTYASREYAYTTFKFFGASMYGLGPDPATTENVSDIPLAYLSSFLSVVDYANFNGQPATFLGKCYCDQKPNEHRFIKLVYGTANLSDDSWQKISLNNVFSEKILLAVATNRPDSGSDHSGTSGMHSETSTYIDWSGTDLYIGNDWNSTNSRVSWIAIGI